MIVEVPAGAFADRFGRKRTFLVGVTLEGAGVLAFGLASSFELLTASYLLWASGIAFGSGNAQAFLYETVKAGGRAETYAKQQGRLQAIMMASGMAGAASGAFLAALLNLEAPIIAAALFYAIAFIVALRLDEPERDAEEATTPSYFGTLQESVEFLRHHAPVRFIILFSVAMGVASMTEWLLMQPFLSSHSVPIGLFGVFLIPVRLSSILGSLGGGRLVELVGIRRAVIASFGVTLVGLVSLAMVDHVGALAGIMAIGLGGALRQPAVFAYINERTSSAMRATVLSVTPFGMAAAFAVLFPFIGMASDSGIRLGFAVLLGVVTAGAGASLLFWLKADADAGTDTQAPPLLEPETGAT